MKPDHYGTTSYGLIMDCQEGPLEIPDEWVHYWAKELAGGRTDLVIKAVRRCFIWLDGKGIKQKRAGAKRRLANWMLSADRMGELADDGRAYRDLTGGGE